MECLSNFTLKSCGCVPFSLPSKYYNNLYVPNDLYMLYFIEAPSHPICGPSSFKCTDDTEYYMTAQEFESLNLTSSTVSVCNCLPTCTSISYDYEISQAMMNWKRYMVDGVKRRFNEIFHNF